MDDHIKSKMKHPFWWAFITSFIIMNWELIVLSIYEFDSINLEVFSQNLKGNFDKYLWFPVIIGLANATFGSSIISFLNTLSLFFDNNLRIFYRWLFNEPLKTKKEYDQLDKKHLDTINALQQKNSKSHSDLNDSNGLVEILREESDGYKDKLYKLKSLFNSRDLLNLKDFGDDKEGEITDLRGRLDEIKTIIETL